MGWPNFEASGQDGQPFSAAQHSKRPMERDIGVYSRAGPDHFQRVTGFVQQVCCLPTRDLASGGVPAPRGPRGEVLAPTPFAPSGAPYSSAPRENAASRSWVEYVRNAMCVSVEMMPGTLLIWSGTSAATSS